MNTPHQSLAYWIDRLSREDMPILDRTAREVAGVSERMESSAAELGRVILQDASMTARVLKLANSSFFNPGGRSISTITRAIVVLGFDTVRGMCLSIALVDSLLQGAQKARVVQEMARAFHAAAQARNFALKRGDESPEEVFIAALLYHLGEMAFWCFGGDKAAELDAALRTPGRSRAEAEEAVLGFRLRQLGAALGKEWHLGPLVENALSNKTNADPRVKNVLLAHELAASVERGWGTPEVRQILEQIAEYLYLPLDAAEQLVQSNARQAARTTAYFGAAEASRLIPMPETYGTESRREEIVVPGETSPFPIPDPALQLRILRELSSLLLEGKTNINLLLEMILEGIYRGVGMDRTLFALLTPDRRYLKAKFSLGWPDTNITRIFLVEVGPQFPNLFTRVLNTQEAIWAKPDSPADITDLLTPKITQFVGAPPFFVAPVVVNGQSIGLFYADRHLSDRSLDEDSFVSFKHFCLQAGLTLTFLDRRGGT